MTKEELQQYERILSVANSLELRDREIELLLEGLSPGEFRPKTELQVNHNIYKHDEKGVIPPNVEEILLAPMDKAEEEAEEEQRTYRSSALRSLCYHLPFHLRPPAQ